MSAHAIPAIIGDGAFAHRVWLIPAKAEKLAKGKPLYGDAHCGRDGWLKPAHDTARLCAKCYPHDKYRTVGDLKAAMKPKVETQGALL